MVSCRNLCW